MADRTGLRHRLAKVRASVVMNSAVPLFKYEDLRVENKANYDRADALERERYILRAELEELKLLMLEADGCVSAANGERISYFMRGIAEPKEAVAQWEAIIEEARAMKASRAAPWFRINILRTPETDA